METEGAKAIAASLKINKSIIYLNISIIYFIIYYR